MSIHINKQREETTHKIYQNHTNIAVFPLDFFFHSWAETYRNILSCQSTECSHLDFFSAMETLLTLKNQQNVTHEGAEQITFDPSHHKDEAITSFCRTSIAKKNGVCSIIFDVITNNQINKLSYKIGNICHTQVASYERIKTS